MEMRRLAAHDRLTEPARFPPALARKAIRNMKVSFKSKEFESDLYDAVAACNNFMAKNCGDEPFYGCALYVDTYYTDCGIFYNTESLYRKTLESYQSGEFGEEYRTDKS